MSILASVRTGHTVKGRDVETGVKTRMSTRAAGWRALVVLALTLSGT